MKILVTGGAGYIGSHVCVELLENGHDVIVLDNLSNSSKLSLQRVMQITQREVPLIVGDILDDKVLNEVFELHNIDAVIHLAALKSVSESVSSPLNYYKNNVFGTVSLIEAMNRHQVHKIIFSSSATVYGVPKSLPQSEDHSISPTNPYGKTKHHTEDILKDVKQANANWKVGILRYFNPIGAHSSGLIGESPNGIPNNLMPYITQVAVGKLPHLNIWGSDYPTKDGTGVRDYIHVVDLAKGHVHALERLDKLDFFEFNLGTGSGVSVLELIKAFEKVSSISIPYKICDRRPGDVAVSYASPVRANKELEWVASRSIEDMCQDTWKWQQLNPRGFEL